MAKVNVSDLFSANSSYMVTCLKDANYHMKNLTNLITNFNNNSTNELVGGGYDAVRAKMDLYIDALQKLSKICTNLISAIPNANNMLVNFMEGYAELDDSKISEVEAELKRAKSYLQWLESYHNETDEKGNTKSVRNGTDGEIADCQALIAKLEALLEKLKLLSPTDNNAFSTIDEVYADVISYANALLKIKITNFDGTFPVIDENKNKEFLAKVLGTSGKKRYFSFDQTDARWQGSGYRSVDGEDIAIGGCGPCSMAAALSTMLDDETINPYVIGEIMGKKGWNNYGGNFVADLASYYGLDYNTEFAAVDNREQALKNLLENGGSVIVGYKGGGHFVAVVGYDSDSNQFIVADSAPSVAGYSDNLYQISYEELRSNTKDLENGINGSVWEAIAPKGMTIEQAISTSPTATRV